MQMDIRFSIKNNCGVLEARRLMVSDAGNVETTTFEGGNESPSQFSRYTGTQTRCRLTLRRNRTLLWLVYFGHPWPHRACVSVRYTTGQWTKAASTPAPSGCPLDDALFES